MTFIHTVSQKKLISVCLAAAVLFASGCTKKADTVTFIDFSEIKVNTEGKSEEIPAGADDVQLEQMLRSDSPVITGAGDDELLITKAILAHKDEFITELNALLANDEDDLLTFADKKHTLTPSYIPQDLVPLASNDAYIVNRNDLSLRSCAEKALYEMALAARAEGVTIVVSSSYRSYEYQKTVYDRNVAQMGKEAADRESARPGTSQHQLGTAADFGSINDDFALTKAGKWLSANAGRFGFSLSFPDGYEQVTGYRWESWHYRYIGKEAAAFQEKWFLNIQQYMLEFIHNWKNY